MAIHAASLNQYHYDLPFELIASRGVEPRDSARMMVVNTGTDGVSFSTFRNFTHYIPEGALVIFNNTAVSPARIALYKETGGKAEVLLLLNEYRAGDPALRAFSNRELKVGWRLRADDSRVFRVVKQEGKIFFLEPEFPSLEIPALLAAHGVTPVPHYLGKSGLPEHELRARYQSIFAYSETEGVTASVAAPTASLHFTNAVFADLRTRGIEYGFVTLHVGLGTFAPLAEEQLRTGKLHEEPYTIPMVTVEQVRRAHREGRPIIAVGTTAARALEAAAVPILTGLPHDISGVTDIFIRPGYSFRIVSGMVTNFHLPETSLMCLVDAFLQHKKSSIPILDLYQRAIAERMRFYSFGDGMLII